MWGYIKGPKAVWDPEVHSVGSGGTDDPRNLPLTQLSHHVEVSHSMSNGMGIGGALNNIVALGPCLLDWSTAVLHRDRYTHTL